MNKLSPKEFAEKFRKDLFLHWREREIADACLLWKDQAGNGVEVGVTSFPNSLMSPERALEFANDLKTAAEFAIEVKRHLKEFGK